MTTPPAGRGPNNPPPTPPFNATPTNNDDNPFATQVAGVSSTTQVRGPVADDDDDDSFVTQVAGAPPNPRPRGRVTEGIIRERLPSHRAGSASSRHTQAIAPTPPQPSLKTIDDLNKMCDDFLNQVYIKAKDQLNYSFNRFNQDGFKFAATLGQAQYFLNNCQDFPNKYSREDKINNYALYIIESNIYYKKIIENKTLMFFSTKIINLLSKSDSYLEDYHAELDREIKAFQSHCPDLLQRFAERDSKAKEHAESLKLETQDLKALISRACEKTEEMERVLATVKETLQLSDEEEQNALIGRVLEQINLKRDLMRGVEVIYNPLSELSTQLTEYVKTTFNIRRIRQLTKKSLEPLLVGRFIESTARLYASYFSNPSLTNLFQWKPPLVLQPLITQANNDQDLINSYQNTLKTKVLACTKGYWSILAARLVPRSEPLPAPTEPDRP